MLNKIKIVLELKPLVQCRSRCENEEDDRGQQQRRPQQRTHDERRRHFGNRPAGQSITESPVKKMLWRKRPSKKLRTWRRKWEDHERPRTTRRRLDRRPTRTLSLLHPLHTHAHSYTSPWRVRTSLTCRRVATSHHSLGSITFRNDIGFELLISMRLTTRSLSGAR